ncbi:MAG TPA: hypothetical protein PKD05_09840 [Candidatus Melainabacteria bacterium]|nr:hypothetical protein [Candidatus Melainabacteria bacterium]HMP51841.1 hypothetical protein [Candidatus Melainabacteria bacterium]
MTVSAQYQKGKAFSATGTLELAGVVWIFYAVLQSRSKVMTTSRVAAPAVGAGTGG